MFQRIKRATRPTNPPFPRVVMSEVKLSTTVMPGNISAPEDHFGHHSECSETDQELGEARKKAAHEFEHVVHDVRVLRFGLVQIWHEQQPCHKDTLFPFTPQREQPPPPAAIAECQGIKNGGPEGRHFRAILHSSHSKSVLQSLIPWPISTLKGSFGAFLKPNAIPETPSRWLAHGKPLESRHRELGGPEHGPHQK